MAKVWIIRPDGRKFHVPVTGDVDINTPATAIPLNAVGLRDRAYSGTVQVVHPAYGTFSINFDPPGRTGSCQQCGSCCTTPTDSGGYVYNSQYGVYVCPHLVIAPGANKLGKKNGSECGIRATIFDNNKGCTLFPDRRAPWMTPCSFTFQGE